jgi:hypothetical protein
VRLAVAADGLAELQSARPGTLREIRRTLARRTRSPILGRPDRRSSYARSPDPCAFSTYPPRVLCGRGRAIWAPRSGRRCELDRDGSRSGLTRGGTPGDDRFRGVRWGAWWAGCRSGAGAHRCCSQLPFGLDETLPFFEEVVVSVGEPPEAGLGRGAQRGEVVGDLGTGGLPVCPALDVHGAGLDVGETRA